METSTPHILLIDDEPMILELFVDWLEDEGHFVQTASKALDGLALVAEGGWDLIISDVYLAPLDGFAIAEFARRIDTNQQLLLITGRADDECLSRADRLGLPVLGKPVQNRTLVHQVAGLLEEAVAAQRGVRRQRVRNSEFASDARYQPR